MGPDGGAGSRDYSPTSVDGFLKLQEEGEGGVGGDSPRDKPEGGMRFLKPLVASEAFMVGRSPRTG